MAGNLQLQISVNADTKQFEAALNKAGGKAEEVAKVLEKFGPKFAGEATKRVNVSLEGKDLLTGKVKAADDALEGLDDSIKGTVRSLKALKSAEKGSVSSLQQGLNYYKQQLSLTNKNSREYSHLAQQVRGYQTALNKVNGIQRGSVAQLKQQASEVERLANSFRIGSAEQRKYQAELGQINAQIRNAQGPFSGLLGVLGKVSTFQAGFIGIAAGIQGITGSLNQFISQAKQLEGFELALRNAGLSAGETAAALAEASEIANDLGAPVQQVEKAFKRMVPALRAVGASSKDTSKFIESITARTQTLGLNTEQSGRFMEAFAQVLSKGKLQAEELNQQISELDGAFRTQLADAVGVSTEELEKLISAGEITSEKFVKAVNEMENGVEALAERVASGNFTVQQLQNLVNNLQTRNLREIGAALEPGIKAFFDIGKVFQEFISTVSRSQFGKFLTDSINGVIIGLRNFVVILTKGIEALLAYLDPIFAIIRGFNDLLAPIGGVIGLLTTYTAFVISSTVAQKAFALATALSSKSLAPLASAIGAAITKLIAYAKAAKAAAAADLVSGVAGNIGSLKGLGGAAGKAGKGLKTFGTKAVYGGAQAQAMAMGADKLSASLHAGYYAAKANAAGSAAVGANAAAAGAGVKGLSLATVGLGAAVAGVVGVLAIVFANMEYTRKEARALDEASKGLTETLKQMGGEVSKTPTFLEMVGEAFARTGRDIARFFGSEQALIDGSKKAYSDYKSNLANAYLAMRQLGVDIYDVNSIRAASDEGLRKSIKIQEEVVAAIENTIKVTKKRIEQAEKEGDLDLVKKLKERLKELEKSLPLEKQSLKNAKAEASARKLVSSAIDGQINSLEDLNKQREKEDQFLDTAKIEAQTAALKRYGISADDNARLTAANTSIEIAASEKRIGYLQREIKEARRLQAEKAGDTEEVLKLQDRERQAVAELAGERKNLANAEREFAQATIDEYERVFQKQSEISGKYKDIVTNIQSGIDAVRSSGSSALGALSQLSDTVFEREISQTGEGTNSRKRLMEEQVRMQVMLGRMQAQIDRAKLDSAYKISQLETQTIQLRLRGEAEIARAKGDEDTAQALESQVSAYSDISRLRESQYQLDVRALNLQNKQREQLIFNKAVNQGLFSQSSQRWKREQDVTAELGIQKTTTQDIKNQAIAIGRIVASTQKSEEKGSQAASQSVDKQRTASEKAKSAAEEFKDAFFAANKGADGLVGRLASVKSEAAAAADEVARIARIVSGGGGGFVPARWMGGSVAAGETYRVNDAGLGREAFLSSSGALKMLPAASNINWTAPTSGTIIPAAIVKQLQLNSDHNARISSANVRSTPTLSSSANRAGAVDSGNLIKQMTTAMSASGGNQRITNHVTIQSQEPVTDASRIMTNVARMRLRNSRRI